MEYYCAMVLTGKEKEFNASMRKAVKDDFPGSEFYFFERKLYTKKRGWFTGSIFPGYIFFSVEKLSPEFFAILKKQKHFCRLLPENRLPGEIKGETLEELRLFIRNGEMWGVSKVVFLPGERIKAVSGPLVGLEGNVIHVNKKYGQITVQSSLTNMSMHFDLKFEQAEKVGEQ